MAGDPALQIEGGGLNAQATDLHRSVGKNADGLRRQVEVVQSPASTGVERLRGLTDDGARLRRGHAPGDQGGEGPSGQRLGDDDGGFGALDVIDLLETLVLDQDRPAGRLQDVVTMKRRVGENQDRDVSIQDRVDATVPDNARQGGGQRSQEPVATTADRRRLRHASPSLRWLSI